MVGEAHIHRRSPAKTAGQRHFAQHVLELLNGTTDDGGSRPTRGAVRCNDEEAPRAVGEGQRAIALPRVPALRVPPPSTVDACGSSCANWSTTPS